MKKEPVITVLKVEPGKVPEIIQIKNELEEMQALVGGYIEVLALEAGVSIVCNEEGKINRLPLNRALRTEEGEIWEIIAGTFFIAGDDLSIGEFVSLTDEQVNFYKEKFYYPEVVYMMGGQIVSKKVPTEFWEAVHGGMTGEDI